MLTPSAVSLATAFTMLAQAVTRAAGSNVRTVAESSGSSRGSTRSATAELATACSMSVLRSYTGRTTTPAGSPDCASASADFTRWMVPSAFSPNRITTMPPTASPRRLLSGSRSVGVAK